MSFLTILKWKNLVLFTLRSVPDILTDFVNEKLIIHDYYMSVGSHTSVQHMGTHLWICWSPFSISLESRPRKGSTPRRMWIERRVLLQMELTPYCIWDTDPQYSWDVTTVTRTRQQRKEVGRNFIWTRMIFVQHRVLNPTVVFDFWKPRPFVYHDVKVSNKSEVIIQWSRLFIRD